MKRIFAIFVIVIFSVSLFSYIPSYIKKDLLKLTGELEAKAIILAQKNYDYFKGWDGEISDREQKVLFSSSNFIASIKLFKKLLTESESYYSGRYLNTNLYNAFRYVANYFEQLKEYMYALKISPYELRDIEYILNDMEGEFSRWGSSNNLSYLSSHYVKGKGDTVYFIQREGIGKYVKRPFKNLESLYAFTFFKMKKKDPWKLLKKISLKVLYSIPDGKPIIETFEGRLVIEKSKRANRPVYLIKNGKKCPLSSPSVLNRYGGWKSVYEIPGEIIDSYPTGETIK